MVDKLEYHENKTTSIEGWSEISTLRDKRITGRIIIDFVSAGDFSEFIKETENITSIVGLSDKIGHSVIYKEFFV